MVVVDALVEHKARTALRVLSRRARVRAAFLFGSHVEGTADRWSDIDVAAFIEQAEPWNLKQRIDTCVEARRVTDDEVELHLFPVAALENPPRASLAQYVLKHGMPLDIPNSSNSAEE